ncbi:unnamed protein product [Toxocara canis]|uniref:Uncharacterized protein n=1 Tax=Toxocara canis TaxID=6265 RepID=A0A183U8N0_TOXCA|nr:unnamed protein product [Toxocara canis]
MGSFALKLATEWGPLEHNITSHGLPFKQASGSSAAFLISSSAEIPPPKSTLVAASFLSRPVLTVLSNFITDKKSRARHCSASNSAEGGA